MQILKSSWVACLAALVGFGVGAWLFHTRPARAQASPPIYPFVLRVKLDPVYTEPGVVGFACIPDPDHHGSGICYVATR